MWLEFVQATNIVGVILEWSSLVDTYINKPILCCIPAWCKASFGVSSLLPRESNLYNLLLSLLVRAGLSCKVIPWTQISPPPSLGKEINLLGISENAFETKSADGDREVSIPHDQATDVSVHHYNLLSMCLSAVLQSSHFFSFWASYDSC